MSDYCWCSTCQAHHWVGQCFPEWIVTLEGDEDEQTIRARDAEEAAKRYAEADDAHSAEYAICGKGKVIYVNVAPVDGSLAPTRLRVHGEVEPVYYAIPESKKERDNEN